MITITLDKQNAYLVYTKITSALQHTGAVYSARSQPFYEINSNGSTLIIKVEQE